MPTNGINKPTLIRKLYPELFHSFASGVNANSDSLQLNSSMNDWRLNILQLNDRPIINRLSLSALTQYCVHGIATLNIVYAMSFDFRKSQKASLSDEDTLIICIWFDYSIAGVLCSYEWQSFIYGFHRPPRLPLRIIGATTRSLGEQRQRELFVLLRSRCGANV